MITHIISQHKIHINAIQEIRVYFTSSFLKLILESDVIFQFISNVNCINRNEGLAVYHIFFLI